MTHPTLEYPAALAEAARAVLEELSVPEFYLAGSAALALYLGHRPVRGLDWMAPANRLQGPQRRDLLQLLVERLPETRVETARDGYLFVACGGVPVRFFYYPYPLIDPFEEHRGHDVASAVDLGLMKLGALISRGTKRDFVDLHLLCRRLPLEELLERSPEKFGHVRDFPLQALKGLADRSLAAGEPMPRLAEPLEWATVETWLDEEVRRLGRGRVGLGSPSTQPG